MPTRIHLRVPARELIAIAVLSCGATAPVATLAAERAVDERTAGSSTLQTLTPSPTEFVRQAAEGSTAEIRLSQLARERTADPDVRRFAAQMITDHRKVSTELESIAGSKGIALPKELEKVHESALESLRRETARGFDDAYLALMQRHHLKAVALFEAATRATFADPELKGFAIRTLPTIKEHLDKVREFPGVARTDERMDDGASRTGSRR